MMLENKIIDSEDAGMEKHLFAIWIQDYLIPSDASHQGYRWLQLII